MALGLGKEIVIEGVETEAQMDFIRTSGCHWVQGFYLSRPLPEDELLAFVRRAVADLEPQPAVAVSG